MAQFWKTVDIHRCGKISDTATETLWTMSAVVGGLGVMDIVI